MKKMDRTEAVTYLNTTPSTTATYKVLGWGINAYGIDYNPQVSTEKDIIHQNASTSHDGNQKQGTVSQKIYKDDPCFVYVNSLRDKSGSDVETDIIDIDTWDEVSDGVYRAKKSDVTIAVTKYMDETAVIEYDIYYNGDPVEGTATITAGVPTFTSGTSL
jgi:hypothetical protein